MADKRYNVKKQRGSGYGLISDTEARAARKKVMRARAKRKKK